MSGNEAEVRANAAVLPQVPKAREEQLPLFSREALGAIRKEEAEWRRDVLDPVLKKKPFWKSDYTTVSGMEVNPLATPLSVAADDFHEITYPGQFPYTRGIHPTGY